MCENKMESEAIYILGIVLILLTAMISYTSYIFWTICQEKRKTETVLQRRNAIRRTGSENRYNSSVNLVTCQCDSSAFNSPLPSYADVDEPPPNYEEVMRIFNPAYQDQQPTLPPTAASLAPSEASKPIDQ